VKQLTAFWKTEFSEKAIGILKIITKGLGGSLQLAVNMARFADNLM
jgi:hypothetical protein